MYTLVLNKILQYKLVINSFTKTSSLNFKTNEIVQISISQIIARIKFNLNLSLPFKLTNTSTKLRTKLSTILRMNITKIGVSFKSREKISIIFNIPLTAYLILKSRIKTSSIISIYNKLIFTPLLGKFFPLSDYDPQTLSALDGRTLNDMDYVLV